MMTALHRTASMIKTSVFQRFTDARDNFKLFGGKDPRKTTIQLTLIAGVIIAGMTLFQSNFRIGFPPIGVRCIDGNAFLTVLSQKELKRDKIYAFRSKGQASLIVNQESAEALKDGTLFVKYLRGLPGDTVEIKAEGTYVNGWRVALGMSLFKQLGAESPEEFYTSYVLGEDEYFFMGTLPESFDGRYYGESFPVKSSQIYGRSYVIY